MTDIDFDSFGESLRYALRHISGNTDKEKPKDYESVSKSPLFQEIKEVSQKLNLLGGDLARISSWGVKDDHPVLIDAGLTSDIFDQFYEDSSSS